MGLWRAAMRDATPLEGRDRAPGDLPTETSPAAMAAGKVRPADPSEGRSEAPPPDPAPLPAPPPRTVLRPVGRPRPQTTATFHPPALDTFDPAAGLDRRTADRLKRGRRPPEARLDLHGMTADRAHASLSSFIRSTRAQGLRCVLVVTGKGGRKPVEDAPFMPERTGVLRHAVPLWLGQAPLAHMIVGIYPAHRSHGGEGALYVYLRKIRG
ncbi:Smr/MutS family protein [Albimonas pacifica]|uniref:DNA-nicking endonuclease, Smr domain n=1 Tax=Albimonas pacifica TaxID=1114924 RepID=A0A1I3FQD5_9RHOB|nr:Smr/MutS family protein [Albimonas pacifica]SFI13131.1 DNA-nicking endonuclease, Smr domain [Albimonas pacifica]